MRKNDIIEIFYEDEFFQLSRRKSRGSYTDISTNSETGMKGRNNAEVLKNACKDDQK